MDTKVNYTIVGAFVIFLLTAMIVSIIWLSSGFSFEQYKTYALYMHESVSGLSIDAPVEFNGVNVGSVSKVFIDQKNPETVDVLLTIKSDTPVTQGTIATLASRGITGLNYIQLKDNSTNLKKISIKPGDPYPVIQTAPSLFTRIDTALGQLSKNLRLVTESVQSVLDKENQQSIKATLIHLDQITAALAAHSKQMSTILNNTAKASQSFNPLLQRSVGAMQLLETQTLPTAYRLLLKLDNMTNNLSELSNKITQNPSILIRGSLPSLGPGEKQ
jgi:phospholipid/cholesterol/gamma-HCH transport system substrate-binding protein